MRDAIIRCEDISFAYDRYVAVKHFSLTIDRGDAVVLAGPNGCGKSTMLKIFNGLIYPQRGQYYFEDTLINEKTLKDKQFAKQFHQKVGFVFQNADVQLFCGSVQDEIMFGPLQMGMDEKAAGKRCDDLLKLMQIEHLRDRAPYHLSGGEKRKVSLACILSMNPEVLVLDEPLAGLDSKSQRWLISFLKAYKAAGKTMILSTHNESLAEELGDYVVELNESHEIAAIREL